MIISLSKLSATTFLFILAKSAQGRLSSGSVATTVPSSSSVDDLWAGGQISFSILPEVDKNEGTYKIIKSVSTDDGNLRLVLKLKGSDDSTLENLFFDWENEKEVGVSWEVDKLYYEVKGDGEDPDLKEVLGGKLLEALQNLAITPICGFQKVVAPVTISVDGKEYEGSMSVGMEGTTPHRRRLDVQQDACEMGGIWGIWDTCAHTDCGYIENAGPQITGTCTLGALMGGVTATGTAFGGVGGAEMGVTMTTTATCWNEFTGTCKFVNSWFDYCTCHATTAPNLKCNSVSPCQGVAGAACSNPTWTCAPQSTSSSSSSSTTTSTSSTSTSTSSTSTSTVVTQKTEVPLYRQ